MSDDRAGVVISLIERRRQLNKLTVPLLAWLLGFKIGPFADRGPQ